MGRMVRKQLYIDAELDKALTSRAASTGESQAGIVREAVSRYLTDGAKSAQEAAAEEYLRLIDETVRRGNFTMGGPIPSKEELHEREGWHPDR